MLAAYLGDQAFPRETRAGGELRRAGAAAAAGSSAPALLPSLPRRTTGRTRSEDLLPSGDYGRSRRGMAMGRTMGSTIGDVGRSRRAALPVAASRRGLSSLAPGAGSAGERLAVHGAARSRPELEAARRCSGPRALPTLLAGEAAAPFKLRPVDATGRRGRAPRRLPKLEHGAHVGPGPEAAEEHDKWMQRVVASVAVAPSAVATNNTAHEASPSGFALEQEDPCVDDVEPQRPPLQVDLSPTLVSALARYQGASEDPKDFQRMQIVFKRFCLDGSLEMPRQRLHDVLAHLGVGSIGRRQVDELAASLSRFSDLDWVDFTEFISKSYRVEQAAALQAAEACLAEGRGGAAKHRVDRFLRAMGVFVAREAVDTALQTAERSLEGLATVDDLLCLLAAFRVNEGFSASEVAEAKGVFDGLERHPRQPSLAKASGLSAGLLEMEGLYCVDHLSNLMQALPCTGDGAPGVSFYEFLVWARRLRCMGIEELWAHFAQAAGPDQDRLAAGAVCDVAASQGFTLLGGLQDDLLRLHRETAGESLDFDAVVRFIREVRKTNGFTAAEAEHYKAAFARFDEGSGELTMIQVVELMRYLGYRTSSDEVHRYVKKVDFNENGTMDIQEYMRLMQLLRESYVGLARRLFDDLRGAQEGLRTSQVPAAVAALGGAPDQALQERIRGLDEPLPFPAFLRLVDRCRAEGMEVSRRRAGFPDDVHDRLREIFRGPDRRESLTIGDLLWMLSDSPVEVNTRDGRAGLLRKIDAARSAAADAGVPEGELGQVGSSIGFPTLVHLVRGLTRESEQRALGREQEAIRALRVDASHIEEYRRLFTRLADEHAVEREDAPEDTLGGFLTNIFSPERIPSRAVLDTLRSLSLRMSASQLEAVGVKIREVSADSPGWLEFGGFLQVVHWLVDAGAPGRE